MTKIARSLIFLTALFIVGTTVMPNADAQYRRHHRHHHHHRPRR